MKQEIRTWRGVIGCGVLAILASAVVAQSSPVKPAAVVNGESIPAADVEREVDNIIKTKLNNQQIGEDQRKEIRGTVLEMYVNDVLMRQFMDKNAPKVEPAEVDHYVADVAAHLQKQMPPKTLADFFKETNQTEEAFRTMLNSRIRWDKYVKAQVKDSDVLRYYTESKDFFDQASVRISHILVKVPATASEADRKAARQKLLAIRADIVAGKIDFAEAAKKCSECPSAPSGGDLGYIARKGMIDENVARVAFMMKVGEVSDIVVTDYGIHVLKLTDRRPGTPSNFEAIKAEVREYCVQEMVQEIVKKERKTAKIEINP